MPCALTRGRLDTEAGHIVTGFAFSVLIKEVCSAWSKSPMLIIRDRNDPARSNCIPPNAKMFSSPMAGMN